MSSDLAKVDLDQTGPLHPSFVTHLFRFPKLAQKIGYQEPQDGETMFQSYEIPLDTLQAINSDFELGTLTQIIFHADEEQAGMVWLDEIGFRTAQ